MTIEWNKRLQNKDLNNLWGQNGTHDKKHQKNKDRATKRG